MNKMLCLAGFLLALSSCGDRAKNYDATGTFEATEVTVTAEAPGELQDFNVEEGQWLESGTKVGRIDDRQLVLKREQLETNNDQLTATYRQLEANKQATSDKKLDLSKQVAALRQQIAHLQRERQCFAELLRDGAAARKQVDDIDNQIQVAEKQLAATEEQISAQNNALSQQDKALAAQQAEVNARKAGVRSQQAQIDDQIAHADVRAAVSGTVLEKYAERGEFVSVGKPLFKIADTQTMFLRAYLTSAQLKTVKLGQKVQLTADYGGGAAKTYDGVVTWISNRAEFTPKTIVTDDERADLVYAVKVRFRNDGYVKIGMYGKVKF